VADVVEVSPAAKRHSVIAQLVHQATVANPLMTAFVRIVTPIVSDVDVEKVVTMVVDEAVADVVAEAVVMTDTAVAFPTSMSSKLISPGARRLAPQN